MEFKYVPFYVKGEKFLVWRFKDTLRAQHQGYPMTAWTLKITGDVINDEAICEAIEKFYFHPRKVG